MRVVEVSAFGGPEVLVLREVAAPRAGPGQAVVAVSVVPVLFLDTQIRRGEARSGFPTAPPYVPGSGVAGTVTGVGEGVAPRWQDRNVVASTQKATSSRPSSPRTA